MRNHIESSHLAFRDLDLSPQFGFISTITITRLQVDFAGQLSLLNLHFD